MGVEVHRLVQPVEGAVPVVAPAGVRVIDRRLYWNADKTRLVEEGDPASAFLAYTPGTAIPEHLVTQLSLVDRGLPVEPAEKVRARRRRGDREVAPGVVADTSVDGVAHVLATEPGTTTQIGVSAQ